MKTKRKPTTLPLLYVAEEHLGISARTAYDCAAEGTLTVDLPVLRVGRQWRVPTAKVEATLGVEIDPADVERWLTAHAEEVAAERQRRAAVA